MVIVLTLLVGIFFAGMGLVALVVPERISATFGTPTLTPAGRNEVRAVYGGFGVAVAGLLFAAPVLPTLAPGIYLTVALALGGMAAGRVVAAAVESPRGFYPAWFYCGLEVVMAAILLLAAGSVGINP